MKFTNRIKTNSQVWPWLILGLTTLSILPVISVKSSTPQLISYQALITDPSGEPINQTVNIEFKIWNQPSGGTLVWTEMHNSMQITDGKLSVLLGSFTPLNSSILQDTGLYLGVKVGVDPEIFPRSRLATVPFAYRINTIDGASGGDVAGALRISPDPAKAEGDALEILNSGGQTVLTAKVNASGFITVSLFDPVDSKDGRLPTAVERIKLTKDGIFILDTTGTDTTLILNIAGDIISSGQIQVGANASSASATTVFGVNNTAIGDTSTIGGGSNNIANGDFAVIAGGKDHVANEPYATVSGGFSNFSDAEYATVSGGLDNIAASQYSTVSGGSNNDANGVLSFIGGGNSNRAGTLASDTGAFVGGGTYNKARGRFSVVSGGGGQVAADSNSASGMWSTISGGSRNVAGGNVSTISGGSINTANSQYATVGGGFANLAGDQSATIAGGRVDTAKGLYSGVASGYSNLAGDASADTGAFVGGGVDNSAIGSHCTVSGGKANSASFGYSTIGGGSDNIADTLHATVAGGFGNIAGGVRAFVGGGAGNTASGLHSTVPGGYRNTASGRNSFAAGYNAQASHHGAIVFSADSTTSISDSTVSSGVQQMVLRATGFFYLTDVGGSASIPVGRFLNTSTGAYLTTGGTWTNLSDKNCKENFSAVDDEELLQSLSELDIQQWNYKAEGNDIKHIGPVSQDFYEKFQLGQDDKSISTIDADGVALAAIQALYNKVLELEAEVKKLKEK